MTTTTNMLNEVHGNETLTIETRDLRRYERAEFIKPAEFLPGPTDGRGWGIKCPKCGGHTLAYGDSPWAECHACGDGDVTVIETCRPAGQFSGRGTDGLYAVVGQSDWPVKMIDAAARVMRGYRGTRLYGALRRAGLEAILRPHNGDLMEAAMQLAKS